MSEYWLTDSGSIFADGDIGDKNHEYIVIDAIMRQITEACEATFELERTNSWGRPSRFSDDEYIDWDEFITALAKAYAGEKGANDPHKYAPHAAAKAGVKRQQWEVVTGQMDARTYAMMYWGWKTYRDRHIDTWFLRRNDLQAIVEGINEIAYSDGWSEKKLSRAYFSITIFSTNKQISAYYHKMVESLERPAQSNLSQPIYSPQFDYLTPQASKQVQDIELDKMHPAYKRPGVQAFGDSVMSFKAFVEQSENRDWDGD